MMHDGAPLDRNDSNLRIIQRFAINTRDRTLRLEIQLEHLRIIAEEGKEEEEKNIEMQNQSRVSCERFTYATGSVDEMMQLDQQPQYYSFQQHQQQQYQLNHANHRHLSPTPTHQRLGQAESYLHLQPSGNQIQKHHQSANRLKHIASYARQVDASRAAAGSHFRSRVASVSTGSSPDPGTSRTFLTRSTSFSNYPQTGGRAGYAGGPATSPVQYMQVSPPPTSPSAQLVLMNNQQLPEEARQQHLPAGYPASPHHYQPQQSSSSSSYNNSSISTSSPSSSSSASNYSNSSNLAALSPSDALNLGINLEQYISKRNERERSRVKNVNDGFDNLKNSLPIDSDKLAKRMSKVEILRTAISYIKNLEEFLKQQQQNQQVSSADELRSSMSQQQHKQPDQDFSILNSPDSSIEQIGSPSTSPQTLPPTSTNTTRLKTEFNSINVYQQTITSTTSCNNSNNAQSQQQQTQFGTSQTMTQVAYAPTDDLMQHQNQDSYYLNFANQPNQFNDSSLPTIQPVEQEQQQQVVFANCNNYQSNNLPLLDHFDLDQLN